jgi:hypothetical protein
MHHCHPSIQELNRDVLGVSVNWADGCEFADGIAGIWQKTFGQKQPRTIRTRATSGRAMFDVRYVEDVGGTYDNECTMIATDGTYRMTFTIYFSHDTGPA